MRKPVLVDAFCKSGGCTRGYQRAGFYVIGIDIEPQPNYIGDEFIQADALEYLASKAGWPNVAAIHASPPCQMFSQYRHCMPGRGDEHYVNLIPETRELLQATGLPYVIENVEGAPLVDPVRICGSMFDPPLDVQRHRLFETNWPLKPPVWPCRHKLWGPDRFSGGRSVARTGTHKGLVRNTVEIGAWDIPLERQKQAMGVDWELTVRELSNAIPPVYTEHIGRELLAEIGQRVLLEQEEAA